MNDRTLTFTQSWVNDLENTSGKRIILWDSKATGLQIDLMPSGSRVYRFVRTYKSPLTKRSERQTKTIGKHPEVSLDQARDAAVLLSAELIKGSDFKAERQAKRDELTVRELAEEYFTNGCSEARTLSDMRKNFERWFQEDLDKPISEITTSLLRVRLTRLKADHHPYRANRALELIRAAFNFAIKEGLCTENPADAKRIKPYSEQSRQRFLQPEEFVQFMRAVEGYPDKRVTDFIKLCLYTGARSGNLLAMRWDEIDFVLGNWTIPKTKNGESQIIALSDAALEVLEERSEAAKGSINPWVLPGGGKAGPTNNHLVEPKKGWASILQKAGIKDLRVHDLRRTAGSMMAMTGANSAVIQKALGHKSMAAAAVYQRVNNDPARQAMNQALKFLSQGANTAAKKRRTVARRNASKTSLG
jgi:integrase